MNTYYVHVYVPTVYEIEADTQEEAEDRALVRYKKGKRLSSIEPRVETWIKPKVYKGKSMHEMDMEDTE